jgi:hypothetical protein
MAKKKSRDRATKLAYPWWVTGIERLVVPVLPEDLGKDRLGCVYDLELKSGGRKIGSSSRPGTRIRELVSTFRNYANDSVVFIRLSLPVVGHYAVERAVHESIKSKRLCGEIFKASDSVVERALVEAMSSGPPQITVSPLSPSLRRRCGRPSKPWFRAQTKTWVTKINGRQHTLGQDEAEAHIEFERLMGWCAQDRMPSTSPTTA